MFNCLVENQFNLCFFFQVIFVYADNGELSFNWKVAMKLYRSTFFIIMHIFCIGINSYGWSRSGVNHVLIFEIDPRNHLTYQQYLEVSSLIAKNG
jgi:hypothetical protein